jgi:hypothetical protein
VFITVGLLSIQIINVYICFCPILQTWSRRAHTHTHTHTYTHTHTHLWRKRSSLTEMLLHLNSAVLHAVRQVQANIFDVNGLLILSKHAYVLTGQAPGASSFGLNGQTGTFLIRMCRVGQNRLYTPYMTVFLVNSLLKIPYMHLYIWFWPTLRMCAYRPSI